MKEEQFQFSNRLKAIFAGISIIGLLIALVGIYAGDISSYRAWGSYLVGNIYFLLAALSGIFIFILQYATNAGWSAGFKRIPLAMSSYVFIAFIGMLVIILFGIDSIYHHWADPELLDAESSRYDPIVEGKAPYLNAPFFAIRYFVVFAFFMFFVWLFRKWAIAEDYSEGTRIFRKIKQYSYPFLILFALLFTVGTFDWLMSIDSHWYSTIYSIYVFAGMAVMGIVIITLSIIALKKQGFLSIVKEDHIHDLGKFMFGFSIFWMYIWFAQFMLIWYADLPETNIYYIVRMQDNYEYFFYANILINFALPFFALMTRNSKRHYGTLIFVGTCLLIGRYIDWHLLVQPGVTEAPFAFGLPEIGFFAFFGGLFMLTYLYTLSKASLIPYNHPHLKESEHHEVFP